MYKIEPIYIIFLTILTVALFLKKRKRVGVVFIVLFIVLFICSENGADYRSYGEIYWNVEKGVSFSKIHGEWFYLLVNRIFSMFFSYNFFRVVFLSFFLILLIYSVGTFTDKWLYTFALIYMGLILHLISSYRQFAGVAIFIFSLHCIFHKKQAVIPILLSFIGIFLHMASAVGSLIIIILVYVQHSKKRRIQKGVKNISYILWLLLIFAIGARILLSYVLSLEILHVILKKITVYSDLNVFTFGFASRLTEFIILLYFYHKSSKDHETNCIFLTYAFLTLFYIAIPIEFFMARLTIAARFLIALLIPMLAYKQKRIVFNGKLSGYNNVVRKKAMLASMYCLYIAMFVYQMLYQVGYTPYINMLFN